MPVPMSCTLDSTSTAPSRSTRTSQDELICTLAPHSDCAMPSPRFTGPGSAPGACRCRQPIRSAPMRRSSRRAATQIDTLTQQAAWPTALTGTETFSSAKNSRRPETRISRQRMTMAAQSDQLLMVPSATRNQQQRGNQQLVGDGVEHAAQGGLLAPGAGEIAVEEIGDRREGEQAQRRPAQRVFVGPEQAGDDHRHDQHPAKSEQNSAG